MGVTSLVRGAVFAVGLFVERAVFCGRVFSHSKEAKVILIGCQKLSGVVLSCR